MAATTAGVALILGLGGCSGPAAREARYEKRGWEYLAQGKLDKARIEFRNALQIAPANSDARYENGLVAERMGNIREAAGLYLGAVQANDDNYLAHAHLGNLYVLAGLPDEALKQVEPSLAKRPDDVGLLVVRAGARVLNKQRPEALADAMRAVSLDPKNEDAVSTLAGIEMGDGQADNALAIVQKALGDLPRSVALRRVLVQLDLDRKDPDAAEGELVTLTQQQPADKTFRLQLARLYAQTDRLDQAEKTLRQAIEAMPREQDLRTSLVEFLWARRGHEQAEAELKRMISAAPTDYEQYFTLARFYEQSNDEVHAEAIYRDLIDKQGKNAAGLRARDRLAALLTAKNDIPGAEKLVTEVLSENSGDNDALVLRAEQELSHSQTDFAISDLRRVLRDQPRSVDALMALTRAYVADGEPQLAQETARHAVETDPSSVPARIELARALIRTGAFDESRTLLTALAKQQPDDPVVLDLIIRTSIAMGDTKEARVAATELVKVRPSSPMGPLHLGIVEESEGHQEEALADYRKAFELEPRAIEPLRAAALCYERAKRFDDAVAFLDQVAARYPDDVAALELKGEVMLHEGRRLDDAEATFRQVLVRAPKWWDPYRDLAALQLLRADPTSAAQWLRQAATKADLAEVTRLDLASLQIAAGQMEDAIGQYEQVLKVNPKSQLAAAQLAMLLVSYRTDEVSLNRATSLVRPLAGSNDWRLLDAYGWVHYKDQDFTTALPVLEKATAARPDAFQLRFHLGMTQLKSGHKEEAEKNLAASLGPGAQFLGKDEAKAVLAQLRSHKPS